MIYIQPDDQTHFLVNPTGKFVIGGPQGDSGLQGEKLLLIPMVVTRGMEVGHFLVKTRRR